MRIFFTTFLIIFNFLLTLQQFNNPQCKGKRYFCGSENQENICVNITDTKGKVYELQVCPSGYTCNYEEANLTNKTIACTKVEETISILPGESCTGNEECYSEKCEGSVCVGKAENEECKSHKDCDVGYYCTTENKCAAQIIFGQPCNTTYDCQNNLVCSLKKCEYYYSNSEGIAASTKEACSSGYLKDGKCAFGPVSEYKGRTCEKDKDCVILDENQEPIGNTQCQCGYNGGGISYCQLSQGDDEFQDIIKKLQYILQRSQYCHTELRFGPCKQLYDDEYIDYQKAVKYYELNAQIKYNDICIKNVITSEYWEISGFNLLFSFIYIYLLIFYLVQS